VTIDPLTGQFTSVFAPGSRGIGMPDPNIRRQWDNAPGTVLSRAFGRGIDTIQRNLGSTIEGLGNTTGIEALSTYGAGSVARNQAEIEASQAMENDRISTFIGSILGENAPQLATSAGLPAAGAAIGSVVPGVGTLAGAGVGTALSFLFNYGQLAGENREAQKAENTRLGVDTPVDEGAAFGTAVGQSALETLGGVLQARLATRATREASRLFSREGVREVGRSAVQGAATEGATEAAQQAGTRLQAGQDLTSREAIQELAIAGLAGSILGGTLAGGGSAAGIALRPQERVAGTTNNDLINRVDNALTPASARPTAAAAAPVDLFGDTVTEPQRPFASVSDTDIFTAMQAAQTAAANDPASPINEMLPQLRAEAELRGLEIAPQAIDTGTLFEGQTRQDLNKTLRTLNRQAERGALTPEDVQLQTAVQTELRRRDAQSTSDPQLSMIRDNARPSQSRTALRDLRDGARNTVQAEMVQMGLPATSRFAKQSKARSTEELYDEVADLVASIEDGTASPEDQKAFDKTTFKLAESMGFDGRLDERIAAAQQARDNIVYPSNAEIQTPEGVAAFAAAQQARQQADAEIQQLAQRKEQLQAAQSRRTQRLEQAAAQEAIVGDPANARPLGEAFAANPEDGPSWVDRYTDLPATLSDDQKQALAPAGAEGSFGTVFAEALNGAQRARLARRAELAQQEQQFTQAERARMEQEIKPTEVTGRRIEGANVTVSFTRGAPVTLERRDGQWFVNNRPAGRKLDTAIAAVRDARDVEAGFLRVAPSSDGGQTALAPPGPARVAQVKSAVAAAMRGWEAPYSVYVVSNVDRLPANVRAKMNNTDVSGFVTDIGEVGIVADNLRSQEEAVANLYHEVLGHVGLARLFGVKRAETLQNMYDNSPALREMVDQWKVAIGPDALAYYETKPFWVQIEEAIATRSESGPIRSTYMQRMAKIVADFARRIGLKVKISNAELTAILAEAHKRAMQGGDSAPVGTDEKRPAPAEVPVNPMPTAPEILEAAQTYGDPNTATTMLRVATQATTGLPNTPEGNDTAVGRIIKVAEQGYERVKKRFSPDVSEPTRKGALYFLSLNHIVQTYGDMFPMTTSDGVRTNALAHFDAAQSMRNVVHQIYSRIGKDPIARMGALKPKLEADVRVLMNATFLKVDPRKPLEAHGHLSAQEKNEVRKNYTLAREAWMRVSRNREARKVYDDMIAVNEATYLQQHTLDLYDVIRASGEIRQNIPAARRNPIKKFTEAHAKQDNPLHVREFWETEVSDMLSQAKTFVSAYRSQKVQPQDAGRVTTILTALEEQISKTEGQLRQMKEYPYFHVGRFGDFTAAFKLKTIIGPDGKRIVDRRAREVVSQRLRERGYENIEISENANGASVFMRLDNRSSADDVTALATALQAEGYVTEVKQPNEVDPMEFLSESSQRMLTTLIEEVRLANQPTAGEDQAMIDAKNAYVRRVSEDLKSAFFNRLPDRSPAKVMAQREFRSGYDKDMLRAYAQRQQIAAMSAGSRLAGDMIGEAFTGMTDNLQNPNGSNRWAMISIAREMRHREAERPESMLSEFLNGFRAVNHNYFLAMNPGYWLTQITQVGTNAWPELVKQGASYRDALGVLTGAVNPAGKIVKAAMQKAVEQGWVQHAADPSITNEVLNTVQLSDDPVEDKSIKDFVMYMINTGSIDIGSQARALGRAAEAGNKGNKFDDVMRWASSGSYYLEMTTRLTGALAARQLAIKQGKDLDGQRQMGRTVVNEAFFNYTEANRARAFSRQGIVKEFTPLATAFLSFQFFMTEKYFREFATIIGANRNTPEGKAARRWLGSHLAVMGTLAGGLGLPFVTVIARVIDLMADLLGDDEEPYQVKIAYRNFLADTFGEDVAEVMARGLPRALGFDVSSRIGAADILPFSQLIADRRPFADAIGAMTERSYGSALAMGIDVWGGVSQALQGNLFEGLRTLAPVGLANPLNAIKLGVDGFTDSRNNILPLDPTTSDIVYQLVGLTPAQRAEYSEANFAQSIRRGVVTRRATAIRKSIQNAVMSGDQNALREALDRAREFDQNVDPSFRILPNVSRSVGQATSRQELARLLGAPLGVRATDQRGQELTGFMNTR
jgi:hypothetical protein